MFNNEYLSIFSSQSKTCGMVSITKVCRSRRSLFAATCSEKKIDLKNCVSCSMICKIIFCSEFPDIPDKAGRFTRRTEAKPFAFHPNAKTVRSITVSPIYRKD